MVQIAPDTLRELHSDAGPEWIGAPAIWGGSLNDLPFEADLSGDNESPPVTTIASGLGTFSYDLGTRELDYTIEVSDIMSITAAHIHSGTVGVNGPIAHDLYTGTGVFDPDNPINGTVTLSEEEQGLLMNSGFYINVHAEANPFGEIRGQIEMIGTMGENIVVGVIDTGINVDHPSFAEIGGDGYDHTNPRGQFYGECASGGSLEGQCNDKLIGAYAYNGAPSPEDTNGHGSHTASTAAGNVISTAVISAPTTFVTLTQISGVAPHANIIAYNACNPCLLSGLVAAINQATTDAVDVINY